MNLKLNCDRIMRVQTTEFRNSVYLEGKKKGIKIQVKLEPFPNSST